MRETGAAATPAAATGWMHPIAKWPPEEGKAALRARQHITPLEIEVKKKTLRASCPFDPLVLCDMQLFSLSPLKV